MELKIVFEDKCFCIIHNFKGKINLNEGLKSTLKSIIFTKEDYVDFTGYGSLELNLKKRLELFNDISYIQVNNENKIYPYWLGHSKNELQSPLINNIIEWSGI